MGDSASPLCKLHNMRLGLKANEQKFDVMTGKTAKVSAAVSKKYYDCKLQSVLATK